jgi:primosomal protein N'
MVDRSNSVLMASKTKKGWQCSYCDKTYTHPEKADQCRDDHQLVYVPISATDINKLMNYIMIPDPVVLKGTRIVTILQDALRKSALKQMHENEEHNEQKDT